MPCLPSLGISLGRAPSEIMMESQWRILSDAAHQGETTLQSPEPKSTSGALGRGARVHCKKSKVTAVTRFIRWNQSRERLSKGPARGQAGWISEEGVWWNLSGGRISPMSFDIWSAQRWRGGWNNRQNSKTIRLCGLVRARSGWGVASSHWTSHHIRLTKFV